MVKESAKKNSKYSMIHCHQLGKWTKHDEWVHHDLIDANCKTRVDICISLHSHEYILPFLDWLVNGDKKWIFYKKYSHTNNSLVEANRLKHNPKESLSKGSFYGKIA